MTRLLDEFSYKGIETKPMTIMEDNASAIALIENLEEHKRTRHIDVRYYFCREQQDQGRIKVQYVNTANNLADRFTKTFSRIKHADFLRQLGMN